MEFKDIRAAVHFSDEKMQKRPLFDSDKCFCDLYCLMTGQEQRSHRHAESEKIYYVVEGAGLFRIDGEERRLGPGGVVIARAGQEHGVRNEERENLILLVFMTPRP